jgi:ATP-dependent helicase/nuclease subunit A
VLVVSAHHKQGIASSGRRTWEGLQACDGLWRTFERRGDERYRIESPTQLRLVGGSHTDVEHDWLAEQQRLLARDASIRTWSATALAEQLAPDVPGGVVRPPGRGEAGAALGTAVHATLQVIDIAGTDGTDGTDGLEGTAGLDDLAAHHAVREGIGELAPEVAALVRVALQAPSIELARRHQHWKELYVSAPVGEALLEGFVDLCIDTPDGMVVVDYKTDLVTTEDEIAAKLERYRIQGAAYALALETIVGRPVVECRFVFIGPDGVIERSIDDLGGTRSELIGFLTSSA